MRICCSTHSATQNDLDNNVWLRILFILHSSSTSCFSKGKSGQSKFIGRSYHPFIIGWTTLNINRSLTYHLYMGVCIESQVTWISSMIIGCLASRRLPVKIFMLRRKFNTVYSCQSAKTMPEKAYLLWQRKISKFLILKYYIN